MNSKKNEIMKFPLNIIIKKIVRRIYKKSYYHFRKFQMKNFDFKFEQSKFYTWYSNMNHLFEYKEKKYNFEWLNKFNSNQNIILKAEQIYNHQFNLLGSGNYKFVKEIKWNIDFKTGYIWNNEFYKDIEIVNLNNNADVKVPWELSRFQHTTVLGQAYFITSDKKYLEEFVNQINDWIKYNPVEHSVNWTCAMEVSIRAVNWIIGFMFFNNGITSKEFIAKFNMSLFYHADYIYKNLEKGFPNNNHYLSNLVGLVWLGIYFKNLNYKSTLVKKWLKYGLKELEVEVSKQFYDDGFNFEASTAYHCFTTEMLLYTAIFCKRNDIEFTINFNSRLEKMNDVLLNITKPNGLIPLFGDMDNGRFIMFNGYGENEMRDFRYLLSVAGEYFSREDFKQYGSNKLATVWLFPQADLSKFRKYSLSSKSFDDGGIHILRKNDLYLAVRCGQNGTFGKGGHTHNDQLSFELNIAGEDFIVDPGTYTYTSDYRMRNLFRSTQSHNTIKISNFEQNDFDEFDLFKMNNETKAKVISFSNYIFEGQHEGFLNKANLIHKRRIILNKNYISITDYLVSLNQKKTESYFHLHPQVKLEVKEKTILIIGKNRKIRIIFDDNVNFEIINGTYSSSYGLIERNKIIIMRSTKELITNKIKIYN